MKLLPPNTAWWRITWETVRKNRINCFNYESPSPLITSRISTEASCAQRSKAANARHTNRPLISDIQDNINLKPVLRRRKFNIPTPETDMWPRTPRDCLSHVCPPGSPFLCWCAILDDHLSSSEVFIKLTLVSPLSFCFFSVMYKTLLIQKQTSWWWTRIYIKTLTQAKWFGWSIKI